MSKTKKILVLIILILAVAQLIPHKREAVEINPEMVFQTDNAEVRSILKKACYNCHSNETEYPWYANIVPVSFFLDNHIKEGREHLNFSEWETNSIADRKQLAKDLVKVVEKKEMPMLTYWIIHWEAKISIEERQVLVEYFKSI